MEQLINIVWENCAVVHSALVVLHKTPVKTLGDALLISSLQKEGEVVSELLKIINKLNNIE